MVLNSIAKIWHPREPRLGLFLLFRRLRRPFEETDDFDRLPAVFAIGIVGDDIDAVATGVSFRRICERKYFAIDDRGDLVSESSLVTGRE